MVCAQLDLRKFSLDEARTRLERVSDRPLLIKSDRPPSHLEVSPDALLVNGPAAFYWVHLPQPGRDRAAWDGRVEQLLRLYPNMIHNAQERREQCLQECERYRQTMLELLHDEETQLYPRLSSFLGDERFVREMGYEHRGLREGLNRLQPLLESCLQGQASRKQIEKQELDLHHLFEHHLEREELGMLPLLAWLP